MVIDSQDFLALGVVNGIVAVLLDIVVKADAHGEMKATHTVCRFTRGSAQELEVPHSTCIK